MAKFEISADFEQYELMISQLKNATPEIAKEAVYEGAAIMADAIREEINALPVYPDEPVYMVHKNQKLKGINKEQKQGLLDGLGIAKIWEDLGTFATRIGFAGYNSIKTKEYPKGQPNPMIARSVIRGTSVRKKNDFIAKAIKKASAKAEKKMGEIISQKIDEFTE